MVMELLTGVSLDKRLDEVGAISLAETARILGQVSRALQRAHDAGIIHRDLKPENIFLVRSPDDDDETAKVLDFGIAKIKGNPGEELTTSTKTGAVLGTPYFMSPEQARGLRNLDYRSDLWSLGVIAFKCVTGVLPFDGESVGDLLVKICTSPLPVPSEVAPPSQSLPPSFDAWFARALEREPAARFNSATELADALAMAAGLSLRRGPLSSSRTRLDSGTRSTTGTGSPDTAAATPLPGGGLTASGLEAAAIPQRTSRGALVAFVGAAIVGVVGAIAVLRGASGGSATAVGTAAGSASAPAPAPAPAPVSASASAPTPAPAPTSVALAPPSDSPGGPSARPAHVPGLPKTPTSAVPPPPKPSRPKPAAAADPGY
jgi:serine/threonine-protein kinase